MMTCSLYDDIPYAVLCLCHPSTTSSVHRVMHSVKSKMLELNICMR